MIQTSYNPDVLSCLANLSNDEVFTPPSLANQMLDLLPNELWKNKDAKFLDPVTKSGVFLREIAKRLNVGLEKEIPERQQRINHIYKNQLYGIAITEITSLLSRRSVYCSKIANGKYSVCDSFDNEEGNILFNRIEHQWRNGKCEFCSASEEVYQREDILETHAYEFIHTDRPEKIFSMKFDVIIGNPPYQLSDGGFGISASPIYQKFVQQAKKLNPKYISMIIPSRWFSGGKGLDEFRDEMLNDNRLRNINDYPDASDCFPGVQIKGGICYFLWNRDDKGLCKVATHRGDSVTSVSERQLLEEGCDTFIRYNEAISILKKVKKFQEKTINNQISSRKPFGLNTTFKGSSKIGPIKLYQNGGVGYIDIDQIPKNASLIKDFKVLIPRAGSGSDSFPHSILGHPFVVENNTACTETYIIAGIYKKRSHAVSLQKYISTRFFRFLVLLMKNTQDATSRVYSFVPIQNFDEPWTDEKLYKKYKLTSEEIEFIESMIRPMELDNE